MPYADPARNTRCKVEWARRQREAWFEGKVCAECGSSERLELDHIDPSLKVSHRIWGLGPERRLAELAKCQPLCNTCHKRKTARQAAEAAAARTHCSKGHAFTPTNTYDYGHGRQCRTCQLEWAERSRRSRGIRVARRNVTHCVHGHEYTPANTYVTKAGRYRCKACRAADMRLRNAVARWLPVVELDAARI